MKGKGWTEAAGLGRSGEEHNRVEGGDVVLALEVLAIEGKSSFHAAVT